MDAIAMAVEPESSARVPSERILVLAPTADDAALIAGVLGDHGYGVELVDGMPELARELDAGAGALLIASEAFDDAAGVAVLREVLDRQESWSEIPVLFLGGNGESAAGPVAELLGSSAQIVLLERPLGIATFVTATEAALRSRRRQYEVKRLLDELERSAVQIIQAHEEATRAKDEFLATLGHELRSPMTAIRGWIQMLQAGDLSDEEMVTALAMIDSSTRVQARIVEDLMDVSKIIAGKVMIEPAVAVLAPLVENVVATFGPAAGEQGIHLTVAVPADPLLVWADETRIRQVGWNLLSNAIKFTPRGGSVHVSLVREDDRAVMRVRDTGEGHFERAPAARLRALPASRRSDEETAGRPRPRAGDRAPSGRKPRRHDRSR
jgi:signal transduction histidine kinase